MEAGPISRTTKHTMFQRHMASFDKLLQYAVSRSSTRKLYERLTLLQSTLQSLPDDASNTILSLDDLRTAMARVEDRPDSSMSENEESPEQIVRYFDSFFEELQFLKELKKYFDERVHRYLYEYYYDPTDDLDPDEEEKDLDLDASAGSAFLTGVSVNVAPQEVSDKQRLGSTVRELYTLCLKWDSILSQGQLEAENFDIESAREISIYPEVSSFEPILRLIPDLFSKSSRALELARFWSKEARKVYGDNLAVNTSTKDITTKQEVLKEKILSLTMEIAEAEEVLQEEYVELQTLRGKENRHLKLDEDCKKTENLRNDMVQRFTGLLSKRTKLNGSKDINEERQNQLKLEADIFKAKGDLHVLDFKLNLLKEDYDLEILFLPDIVRFIGEVEQRVNSLEESLQQKKLERDSTEKTISSIKKNLTKMRNIVDKYYKHRHSSGISIETNEAGDSLSSCTSENDQSEDGTADFDHNDNLSKAPTPFPASNHSSGPTHSSSNTDSASFTQSPIRNPYSARNHSSSNTYNSAFTPSPAPTHFSLPTPSPAPTYSSASTRHGSGAPRESVSQSSGILKHSGGRWSLASDSMISLSESPWPAVNGEGNDSRLSVKSRTKNVRWKSPPVSDESEQD